MIIVSPKRTRLPPDASGSSETTDQFDQTPRPSGTSTVIENTAFRSGSSKQGKARRASVGSK